MGSIETVDKPSNAGYVAKIDVNLDGDIRLTPPNPSSPPHQFSEVNIAWYGTDRIKITLKGGGPAAIRQAYLPGVGKNVILDLIASPGGDD